MKEYYNSYICMKCMGKCCKNLPAEYTPKDIKNIFGSVENAIKSNKVSIDCWDASPNLYFMRPRIIGVNKIIHYAWGGQCIHLKNTGCELSVDKRPYFCKRLEPKENFVCDHHLKKNNSKYYAGILWKKDKYNYNKLLNFIGE